MTNPCKDCKEREAGCHTRCPDGIAQDKREKARRDKIKAEKAKEAAYRDCKIHTVERTKRVLGR